MYYVSMLAGVAGVTQNADTADQNTDIPDTDEGGLGKLGPRA